MVAQYNSSIVAYASSPYFRLHFFCHKQTRPQDTKTPSFGVATHPLVRGSRGQCNSSHPNACLRSQTNEANRTTSSAKSRNAILRVSIQDILSSIQLWLKILSMKSTSRTAERRTSFGHPLETCLTLCWAYRHSSRSRRWTGWLAAATTVAHTPQCPRRKPQETSSPPSPQNTCRLDEPLSAAIKFSRLFLRLRIVFALLSRRMDMPSLHFVTKCVRRGEGQTKSPVY